MAFHVLLNGNDPFNTVLVQTAEQPLAAFMEWLQTKCECIVSSHDNAEKHKMSFGQKTVSRLIRVRSEGERNCMMNNVKTR